MPADFDQPELFGDGGSSASSASTYDPAYAALPDSIRSAVDVMAGGADPSRNDRDPGIGAPTRSFFDVALDAAPPPDGPRLSAQQRFLEAQGGRKMRAEVRDAHVHVLDLTKKEDREEYERIMREIYPRVLAEPGHWIWKCGDAPPMIDRDAPGGYRWIRLVEYARTEVKEGHDPVEFGVVGKKAA